MIDSNTSPRGWQSGAIPRALVDLTLRHPDIAKLPNSRGEATAWCPWHDDRGGRNPSLDINVKKGLIICHSCGEKGGLRKLAKAWGIEDPDKDGRTRRAPEPSLTVAAAMQKLREAYALREPTVEHFRITAQVATASPNRKTRGAWRYPTPAGTRFKAFDRASKPKYWWSSGTKPEKRRSTLYGLADITPGTDLVYLVNGEPSVWVCWQAGIPAVCAYGEGNLPTEPLKRLQNLGVKAIRIVPDLDLAGEGSAARNGELIRDAGLEVSAARLPDYLGEKGDVADLYLWSKGDDKKFRAELQELPDRALPPPDALKGTRFFRKDGRFYVSQETRDGKIDIPLTNFEAWAEEEILYDDGTDETLHVLMAGRLDSGRPLKRVKVPAEKAHNLDWIPKMWGYTPLIRSGPGAKDNVREIMQRISIGDSLKRRTVYNHTGWRQIQGEWCFLTPQGSIGEADAEVELLQAYVNYSMPTKPENITDAVRASLSLLKAADHRITIPLLGFSYLAPLQSILRPAFTLWLHASTGSFKSTLAALAMCHFGSFEYNSPPSTWESTARGIERYLYDLKDNLAWIDDFNPRQSEREMQTQHAKADTVLRSLGNVQGRMRMRTDLAIQKTYSPRAILVTTGEIYPVGESVVARTLAIEYLKQQVDVAALSEVQKTAALFPDAMAGYIAWLAEQYAELQRGLPRVVQDLRDRAATQGKEHARTPGTIAALQVAMELLCRFAAKIGALSDAEREELLEESWEVLQEISKAQTARLLDESPVDRYLGVLETLVAQGKVAFRRRGTVQDPKFGEDLIGWYDNDFVYVDSAGAFNRVSRWYRDEGRTLGASEDGIRRALLERQILVKRAGEAHLTRRIEVNGHRHRVMVLDLAKVPFGEQLRKELIP